MLPHLCPTYSTFRGGAAAPRPLFRQPALYFSEKGEEGRGGSRRGKGKWELWRGEGGRRGEGGEGREGEGRGAGKGRREERGWQGGGGVEEEEGRGGGEVLQTNILFRLVLYQRVVVLCIGLYVYVCVVGVCGLLYSVYVYGV